MLFELQERQPTKIFGLNWVPIIYNMDADWLEPEYMKARRENGLGDPPEHFTICDQENLRKAFRMVPDVKSIVEIGVHRPTVFREMSSSRILVEEKHKDTVYLGIDIEDRAFMNNDENNVYTIIADSLDKQKVVDAMTMYSIKEIDFLFIDGLHSLRQVIGEWDFYASRVKVGGVIGFHDINGHPGPHVLFYDAINPEYFEKLDLYCLKDDYGVGFVRRIK